VLRLRLEEIGGEIVGEGGNASGALELFRTLRPQLVTLDLLMPEIGGVERQIAISLDSRKKHQKPPWS
jgi:two-component system chemotaxis response regulator CheY